MFFCLLYFGKKGRNKERNGNVWVRSVFLSRCAVTWVCVLYYELVLINALENMPYNCTTMRATNGSVYFSYSFVKVSDKILAPALLNTCIYFCHLLRLFISRYFKRSSYWNVKCHIFKPGSQHKIRNKDKNYLLPPRKHRVFLQNKLVRVY